ncbi:hypothetical protein GGQ81_000720 [Sphingomonas desiccabilis]|nr:hypothetical protein [Sphingomonas desiccabilis]
MPDPFEEEARRRGVSVETLKAFYAHRSESLRNSHTTTGPVRATPRPTPTPTPTRRPGILGLVADRVTGVLSGR